MLEHPADAADVFDGVYEEYKVHLFDSLVEVLQVVVEFGPYCVDVANLVQEVVAHVEIAEDQALFGEDFILVVSLQI